LQARLFQSKLSEEDVNLLAVVAMAGVAAEAMALPEVRTARHPCFLWWLFGGLFVHSGNITTWLATYDV
jgi:hypothetical protein